MDLRVDEGDVRALLDLVDDNRFLGDRLDRLVIAALLEQLAGLLHALEIERVEIGAQRHHPLLEVGAAQEIPLVKVERLQVDPQAFLLGQVLVGRLAVEPFKLLRVNRAVEALVPRIAPVLVDDDVLREGDVVVGKEGADAVDEVF